MPRRKKQKRPGDRRGTNPKSLQNLHPPFKPGEVHNPTGINRKTPYSDADFAFANTAIPENVLKRLNAILGKDAALAAGTTWAEAIAIRLHLDAVLKGDVSAAREVADRVQGHPRQSVELSGTDDRLKQLIESFDTAAKNPPAPPSPDSGAPRE